MNRAWLEQITAGVSEILPPATVLELCRGIPDNNGRFERLVFGRSEQGFPLEGYVFGNGSRRILLYAFPDPGEAIGGTTILTLMQQLSGNDSLLRGLDCQWIFVPCLNPDDQPNSGQSLQTVSKKGSKEVDWCVDNPRSETRALLQLANQHSPTFTFPLHDEFHSSEIIPAYIALSETIGPKKAGQIRQDLLELGFDMNPEYQHTQMGKGFFVMSELAVQEYPKSTFSVLAQSGLVGICELSPQPGCSPAVLVQAQIAFMLRCLEAQ